MGLVLEDVDRAAVHTDPLTGLPSRAMVEMRLAGQAGIPAVLLLDLDRFEDVNATHGHRAGDALLVEVVRRIGAQLLPGDVLARVGGDSFAIVPGDADGERGARRCAAAVEAALEEAIEVAGHLTYMSASCGMAIGGDHAPTPDALLRDAGAALRRAKVRGGRRSELFDPVQRGRRQAAVIMEAELRGGLERGEFELVYQPIISLRDGSIRALEALLRWNHPRRGVLAPGAFLAVAEKSGLIADIGRWALRQACRQAARWAEQPGLARTTVTVNVSGRQLADPDFATEVQNVLASTGVPPERLMIELTETILMEHAAAPAATVQRLRAAGVGVALDDFGTGYSSLASLHSFPIQTLKVDRSFVAELLTEGSVCVEILGAIVHMARALNLEVVAEGVETAEQLRWITSLGCDSVQGYLLSRPVAAAAAEGLLRHGLDAEVSATLHGARTGPAQPAEPARSAPGGALTLAQACDALGVSVSTLRRWSDSGRIRTVRTAGGHRRFPAAEVSRLNRERGTDSAAAPAVRGATGPTQAWPNAADVVESRASEIAQAASAALYVRGRPGWFAADPTAPVLDTWLAAVGQAFRLGDYAIADEATDRLLGMAGLAGATIVERDRFVELVFELLARRVAMASGPGEETLAVHRLGRVLRQRGLRLADPGAA